MDDRTPSNDSLTSVEEIESSAEEEIEFDENDEIDEEDERSNVEVDGGWLCLHDQELKEGELGKGYYFQRPKYYRHPTRLKVLVSRSHFTIFDDGKFWNDLRQKLVLTNFCLHPDLRV